MASASTYVPIANTVLTTATASITFSSIPSTYTDLVLVISFTETSSATATNGYLTFNSDTYSSTTNYSATKLQGNGSAASSARYSSQGAIYWDDDTTGSGFTTIRFNIMNYSNTTTYKTVLAREDNAGIATIARVGLWRNTAAINAINLYGSDQAGAGSADNFAAGSTFTLYGIQAA